MIDNNIDKCYKTENKYLDDTESWPIYTKIVGKDEHNNNILLKIEKTSRNEIIITKGISNTITSGNKEISETEFENFYNQIKQEL